MKTVNPRATKCTQKLHGPCGDHAFRNGIQLENINLPLLCSWNTYKLSRARVCVCVCVCELIFDFGAINNIHCLFDSQKWFRRLFWNSEFVPLSPRCLWTGQGSSLKPPIPKLPGILGKGTGLTRGLTWAYLTSLADRRPPSLNPMVPGSPDLFLPVYGHSLRHPTRSLCNEHKEEKTL